MAADVAAELGAAPLDLDVLAELIAIALVAAVVAELDLDALAGRTWWSPSWWPRRSTLPGSPGSIEHVAVVAAHVTRASSGRGAGGGRRLESHPLGPAAQTEPVV